MQRPQKLPELPPIARAKAMDEPYQPGQARRRVLLGVVVVAAAIALFLGLKPRAEAPPRVVPASPATVEPGVVFPKLQPSSPAPARAP